MKRKSAKQRAMEKAWAYSARRAAAIGMTHSTITHAAITADFLAGWRYGVASARRKKGGA